MKTHLRNFYFFIYHEAVSCLFPLLIFLALALSHVINIPHLARYDFIFIICVLFQILLYKTGFETKEEMKYSFIFHILGVILEIFKVKMGSWSYPEDALLKIFDVPVYSGFMYASVGSYICQAWKRLHLNLNNPPSFIFSLLIGIVIYLNFFTHHFIYDFRWVLVVVLIFLYFKTSVTIKIKDHTYKMPLVLSFFFIGFFIWLAENIATFFGAWQYPNQRLSWEIVHVSKIGSWFLLVIVSFTIISYLKYNKKKDKKLF